MHSMNRRTGGIAIVSVLTLSVSSISAAQTGSPASGFREALTGGETAFGIRYRLEYVDQEGMEEQALASTARGRMTWNSAAYNAFAFGVEADYVFVAGVEDYNSTTNGLTQFPVVADPEGGDLNQAFVTYRNEGAAVTAGRQRINLGSQRFVGGVAWRQNEQTYDGLRVQLFRGGAVLDYSYVNNVNRIFGPGDGAQPGDWFGDSHFLRGSMQPAPDQEIAAFAYLLDFRNDNGPPNSNSTYGASYRGVFDRLTVDATLARQSDWADNPSAYSAAHYSVQGALQLGGGTLTAGYDVLGSDDGRTAFRTPAATLHRYQGWTDKFLIAPPDGVKDAWFSFTSRVGNAGVTGVYHDFSADEGGMSYGSEVGLDLTYPLSNGVNLEFKLARYNADGYADDTTKMWFVVNYNP